MLGEVAYMLSIDTKIINLGWPWYAHYSSKDVSFGATTKIWM